MKTVFAQHCRFHIPTIVAAACLLASIAGTSAVTINFEGIPGMPNAGPAPVPVQSQLFNQYLSTFGVSFTSGSSFVSVVNLGFGHAVSGTNGIGGSTSGGMLTYDRAFPIVATFFDPANPSTPAITDLVSLRIDRVATSGANVTLRAFDVSGLLIGSFTTADVGGATLQIAAPGIHSVQYIGTTMNTGAAVDDFTFNPLVAVPEPSIGALFVVVGTMLFYGGGRKGRRCGLMVSPDRA